MTLNAIPWLRKQIIQTHVLIAESGRVLLGEAYGQGDLTTVDSMANEFGQRAQNSARPGA
jgi:hypothetical protein